jgi:Tfp pilus assembly protein PilZ
MMKRNYFTKKAALFLVVCLINQAFFPSVALALTSGPTQPEFQGFQQASTENMVDLFTGDFKYNIPLCEIGGYPLNLSYNSNPGMDDEASWVGLGWNLAPGMINRSVRGVPDDFKGDETIVETSVAPETTIGVKTGLSFELFGKEIKSKPRLRRGQARRARRLSLGLGSSVGLTYNSRRGYEMNLGLRPSISVASDISTISAGLGLNFAPSSGLDISLSTGLGVKLSEDYRLSNNISGGFNSREGLKSFNFQTSLKEGYMAISKESMDKGMRRSIGFPSSFSFGRYSYTPTSPLPFQTSSFVFHLTGGLELFGGHPNLNVDGFYSRQNLAYKSENQKQYGYLYLQDGDDKKSVLDYNSELSGQIKPNTPHLPLAYGTPDIFSVSAQGIGGRFSARRNELGMFRPAYSANTTTAGELGLEFGAGLFVHGGANFTATSVNVTKTEWEESELRNNLQFSSDDKLYESAYFVMDGEMQLDQEDFHENIGDDQAVFPKVMKSGNKVVAKSRYIAQNSRGGVSTVANIGEQVRNAPEKRKVRNQVISYLTAKEANKVGLDKNINSYSPGVVSAYGCDDSGIENILRIGGDKRDHHISEVRITQATGQRYVFGVPVYNNLQREVTFSVDADNMISNGTDNVNSSDYGLVSYQANVDNSTRNDEGKEKYFSANQIAPYASAYLLSGILSPDYVDRTGDGITEDDNGDAVKFNYTRVEQDFSWRSPIKANNAKYHPGLLSTTDDDKASYLYGEKELWYPHSIESRTMIAVFHTEDRNDALGVLGENGGKDNASRSQLLRKIDVFSKSELETNPQNPLPIKSIHFEYDYSLCEGIPNQMNTGEGKLTLKKVFFTYGNSERGKLNAYAFDYSSSNFDYNGGHYDRWGIYKKNPSTFPTNQFYPYVLQGDDAPTTQIAAEAWNLNKIILPSGGEINVTYEADDYAFVQNHRAGQMVEMLGFVTNKDDAIVSNEIYDSPSTIRKWMVVKTAAPTLAAEFEQRYLEGIDKIYFDCKVNLNGRSNQEERVKGYLTYDKSGADKAYFRNVNEVAIPVLLLDTKKENQLVHPITFAALQLMKSNRSELLYPGLESNGALKAVLKSLAGLGREVGNLVRGFEKNSMKKGFGKTVTTSSKQSWVRLCNPDFKKLGGGSRVSQVTSIDNWALDGDGLTQSLGQKYTYTTTHNINGADVEISSGVASFEPAYGGEENLMRQPLEYEDKYLLAPKSRNYSETPIGESLFPAPVIGYSKVKVENIANVSGKRSHTGHSEHYYYTSKDFPTKVNHTTPGHTRVRPNPLLKFLKINSLDALAMSQGFAIELNDMHGQMSGGATFDRSGGLVSSKQYHYLTGRGGSLSNVVEVVGADGDIQSQEIGVTTEMWQEEYEEKSKVTTAGIALNTDAFPIIIIPILAVVPWPMFQQQKTQFSGLVTTKLIKRNGILDHVTVTENGSSATTYNRLYDKKTAEVLLTETKNEFDDPVFAFNYPAYWAYEEMGHASENIGATLKNVSIQNGLFTNYSQAQLKTVFKKGDEVMLKTDDATGFINANVFTITEIEGVLVLLTRSGAPVNTSGTNRDITVVRSGHRNQLAHSVGQISSLLSPDENGSIQIDDSKRILNASAVTFSDEWKIRCDREVDECGVPSYTPMAVNPYFAGMAGNWRPKNSFVNHQLRSRSVISLASNNTDGIRQSGTNTDFEPFWDFSNGKLVASSSYYDDGWVNGSTIIHVDTRGNELENEDAIGISSSAIFGYNQTLATAVAGNAQYREINYDGFEDYSFSPDCGTNGDDRHLQLIEETSDPAGYEITGAAAHTGKSSLKLISGVQKSILIPVGESCDKQIKFVETVGGNSFETTCASCLPFLNPYGNKDYYVSAWVANDNSISNNQSPLGLSISVLFEGGVLPISVNPTGPVIDGWQRVEANFSIPIDANKLTLNIANVGNETGYLDDFRFHPRRSNMKSFVYDPQSLRLMATLDENNYATFFEYDDEGLLVRKKLETETGIQTLQEERMVLKKQALSQ